MFRKGKTNTGALYNNNEWQHRITVTAERSNKHSQTDKLQIRNSDASAYYNLGSATESASK